MANQKKSGWQVSAVLGGLIFLSIAVNVCGKKDKTEAPVTQANEPAQDAPPQRRAAAAAPAPAPQPQAPQRDWSRVEVAKLLSEYEDNEVRSDERYKGKFIRTTGIVGEVKKDILGDVYVTIGTGKRFEIPIVQCFVSKGQNDKVSSLSKGDSVTIVGRVDGLMMNVLVKDCEVQ